jgi:DNA-binding transcriptional LysR family regulator
MKTDLNLLRVFDILMEVRSVGRAASRLGLTQSAVSHALARLREQFEDPLFVRTRTGLRPSPRATEIAPAVREGLSLLRDAVSTASFDPASTPRVFSISASSYFCVTLLPRVIERARSEAPLAQFSITAPTLDLFSNINDGTVDLALGGFEGVGGRYAKTALFRERLVWIGRKGSSRSDIASRPRLGLSRSPRPIVPEEVQLRGALEGMGFAPNAPFPPGPSPVTMHDPLSAGALIGHSDLVTMLPKQLAMIMSLRADVEILAAGELPDFEMSMLWHARATADPAHMWLRGLIEAAAGTLR